MRRQVARQARAYASHVSKTPLLLPFKPPAPPTPPPPPPSSSSSSSSPSPPPPSPLPRPRLDYNALLADPAATTRNHILRRAPIPLGPAHMAHLQRLRDTTLLLQRKLESVRAKQRDVSALIKSGAGDRDEAVRQAKKLKTRAAEYEKTLADTDAELLELGLLLPNDTHPDVPVGAEEDAREVERFGPEPKGADERRDHLRICQQYGWLDNDASNIAAGGSWPYLRGTLALLEHALVQYALSIAIKHGFTPVSPPDVVRSDIAWRCGFHPRDPSSSSASPSQTYHLATPPGHPELCLAGTAEIPLSAMFADQIFQYKQLPRKVVGVGKAYRAEAGARGRDTRGLYRVHWFTKVELFAVCAGEGGASEEMMEQMRGVQKEVCEGLGLSVRVLDMPTEELGASAYRKYDMEAWMPGRGSWGEVTSLSNCTTYQSRRLSIRHRPAPPLPGQDPTDGPLPFAHTLNGTAAAIPRLLVALLENGMVLGGKDGGEVVGLELPGRLRRFWVGGDRLGEEGVGGKEEEMGAGEGEGKIVWRD